MMFFPWIKDRKESLIAQAPSTASSKPGRLHTELLLIHPLLNNVSFSVNIIKSISKQANTGLVIVL